VRISREEIRATMPGKGPRVDAPVVGRNEHLAHAPRRRRTEVDVFDHRPTGNTRQRFSGKTRRCVTGRDDDDAAGVDGARGLVGDNCDGHVES